jgi:ATP-dependent Clp protease ATP-binding subunit ClpA
MGMSDEMPISVFQTDGNLRQDLLTEPALAALRDAVHQAEETNWESVRSPHVFMGLLAVPDRCVQKWGDRLGRDLDSEEDLSQLLAQFQELFRQDGLECDAALALNREFLSDNAIKLLRDSYQRALSQRRAKITPMDLLITMLTTPNSIVAECFERIGVTAAKLTELAVMAEQQGSSS